jgi:hypothetical protein
MGRTPRPRQRVCACPKQTRKTRPILAGEDQRWRLIQYLIQTPDLETRDRVAGLLVLLYSQPTARLVRLALSDIEAGEDGRSLSNSVNCH